MVGGLAGDVLSELDTLGVSAGLLGAIRPCVEDIESSVVVLRDDEAGVEVVLPELVLVVVLRRVEGEGERVRLRSKAPVVQQPFEGQIKMVEDGIGIDENANVVVSKNLRQNRGLLPRIAAVLELLNVDVVVFVTMDLSCDLLAMGDPSDRGNCDAQKSQWLRTPTDKP